MDQGKQEGTSPLFTPATDDGIAQAVAVLRAGGLMAIPTETVYGLAADARDGKAVARIYDLKGRPEFNPLIVHVDSRAAAEEWAVFNDQARLVADTFWPGPLTLVLPLRGQALGLDPRASSGLLRPSDQVRGPGTLISPLVTAGLSTVAVRVPAHKTALKILRAFGGPLAAPSANRSGNLSPTTPLHVAQSFGDLAPFILADGPSLVGVESTILDLSVDPAVILRPGALTPEDFASVLGYAPIIYQAEIGPSDLVRGSSEDTEGSPGGARGPHPKSPGQLLKHYAPRTPVRLRALDVEKGEALLTFGSARFMSVRGGGHINDLPPGHVRHLSESGDLIEAASNLFRYLHDLDECGATCIAVMDIPDMGLGIAMNDRLKRAAQK
jgi:L-threonylcarbamoyladenylate synthase